jgi:ABC-type nitrate/sulfonate/bicarbonate transport system substrate-binding protein
LPSCRPRKAALAAWLNGGRWTVGPAEAARLFIRRPGMRVVEKVKADIRDDKFRPMSDKVT